MSLYDFLDPNIPHTDSLKNIQECIPATVTEEL